VRTKKSEIRVGTDGGEGSKREDEPWIRSNAFAGRIPD
jgi:hypothetical protein